jgi:hypothetical protein
VKPIMKTLLALGLGLLLFVGRAAAEESAVPIQVSPELPGGQGLGTKGYEPLADEKLLLEKVTEKEINLWAKTVVPKPKNLSEEEWEKLKKELDKAEEGTIPVAQYTLAGQVGEYVGWFGIVRGREFDAAAKQTRLTIEHKYFDGLTDLHMQVVSIYGAGDFTVIMPGDVTEREIPKLSLVRVFGKVEKGDGTLPVLKADYVRLWPWGRFTFMDYGEDKSNPEWVKLRKVSGDDAYEAFPTKEFYEERLGPR